MPLRAIRYFDKDVIESEKSIVKMVAIERVA